MKAAATRSAGGEVSDRQLREAEEGLIRLLYAKRFPREWIERHAPEAMAQARTDFAARLAVGREDGTVGLLVVIGYRRALNILRAERSRPQTTSIETLFHLADEATRTPEQETIDRDRQERVLKAMGNLPERERKLMALVYFENLSIRAAGRQLGWGKSAANRHHQAALQRLEAMLDRSLLSPEIAIPAFVASRHRTLPRAALLWIEGAAETIRDTVLVGGGRVSPMAETGNAVALSGAGRTAAGVCGATALVCLAGAAGGVVGPGLGALHAAPPRAERAAPARANGASAAGLRPAAAPAAGPSTLPVESAASATRHQGTERAPSPKTTPVASGRGRTVTSTAPAAIAKQTINEFGVESGEAEGAPSTGAREPEASSSPTPQAARPSTGSAGSGSSGSSSSEFGM